MKSMVLAIIVLPPLRKVFSGKFDGRVKLVVVSFFFAGRSFAWLLPCTSWGVRLYVKMTDCSTAGEKLDQMKAKIAAHAGEAAAKMIYAAIAFEVQEIRPLADFGQGWEKSI